MIDIDRSKVKGDLPDEVFDFIVWDRLEDFCRQAVLAQDPDTRSVLSGGPRVDLDVRPFDEYGTLWVFAGGQPLLKLHASRLMPWNPGVWLDEMAGT